VFAVHLVCAFCRKDLGSKPPLDDARMTHGMCPECSGHFGAQWDGMSYQEYLERFDFPVVVVGGDLRVVAANRAAGDMLGRESGELIGLLGGEALECSHARLPGGCGQTVHCTTCTIRNAVTRASRTGEASGRVPALLSRSERTYDLMVSATRDGELVRVTVEPVEN
jgi:PAS domain-containing protein